MHPFLFRLPPAEIMLLIKYYVILKVFDVLKSVCRFYKFLRQTISNLESQYIFIGETKWLAKLIFLIT